MADPKKTSTSVGPNHKTRHRVLAVLAVVVLAVSGFILFTSLNSDDTLSNPEPREGINLERSDGYQGNEEEQSVAEYYENNSIPEEDLPEINPEDIIFTGEGDAR